MPGAALIEVAERPSVRLTLLASAAITPLHAPSIGVKPAGGTPCCFQRSESTYDSIERVHDAIRQCVSSGVGRYATVNPPQLGERLAQPIDRPFSIWVHVASIRLSDFHTSVPAATWAATWWAFEQLPRYWKPVQVQRATPIQDGDLVELAGLALAGDADHPFARNFDGAETTAGASE